MRSLTRLGKISFYDETPANELEEIVLPQLDLGIFTKAVESFPIGKAVTHHATIKATTYKSQRSSEQVAISKRPPTEANPKP